MKILVADDDRDMVDILSYWLKGHGYEVVRAFDGEQAIKRWRETLPDLVILDVEMPKIDGFEVCRQMRNETNSMVLILTAHDQEEDEIRGLELGADDYLRKPFSPRQLLARIKAILRRASNVRGSASSSTITVGPFSLDAMRHEVVRDGVKIRLTPTESRLLHLLMTHTGQVLTTDMIIERVWGYDEAGDSGLVKTHIRHLRQKIEPNANQPRYITTVPGVGYTFTAPTPVES
ncbi:MULTISPECIES: response regulator transcription factor [Thermogemmatispora]|nr:MULTISPECIES: response regulator transcription factor [Thermogemmatispora]MBE3566657.1 response regulator transcription factor [Thermogemmatispora sp.]GER82573.1 alkaline phosphatase synthesis transcriptional regulatory protein PhoP [Thermogemmatispora aurantia]